MRNALSHVHNIINSFEYFHILYWRLPSKIWVRPTIPTLVLQQQFVNLEEPGQIDIYQEIKSAQWRGRGIEYFSATKGTKHKKQTNTEYRFYYIRRRMYQRKNVNEKLIKIWGWTEQQEVILGIFLKTVFLDCFDTVLRSEMSLQPLFMRKTFPYIGLLSLCFIYFTYFTTKNILLCLCISHLYVL